MSISANLAQISFNELQVMEDSLSLILMLDKIKTPIILDFKL